MLRGDLCKRVSTRATAAHTHHHHTGVAATGPDRRQLGRVLLYALEASRAATDANADADAARAQRRPLEAHLKRAPGTGGPWA
jgi:hypothetical protein